MKSASRIAADSLRANIMTLPSGKFLTAGQNQFQTLWTRDFCHSVRGLLSIGEKEVVENHLDYLLQNLRADGLVPRVIDNLQVQYRVSWQALRKNLPFLPKLSFKEPLKPQYTDEHGSNAFDSNLLLIRASLAAGEVFWKAHELDLRRVWHWYDDKFRDGLIWQAPFSDWQDTTKREGHTFLLNFFYFEALVELEKLGWRAPVTSHALKQSLKKTFWNGEVFLSQKGYPQVSVEGNLFALFDENLLDHEEKAVLWKNLKNHPVVKIDGVIGRCCYPDWPSKDLAIHIKLASLTRYHGSLAWSWLMGLGLLAAIEMNDQEMIEKQTLFIDQILKRDGEVFEVFDPEKDFKPWGSWLIQSEHPFAWGSAYLTLILGCSRSFYRE